MNNTNESINLDKERQQHDWLVSSCAFNEFYARLSFERRVAMKLGDVHYTLHLHPHDLEILSNEELVERLNSIKRPWWNDMFREIENNTRLLWIISNRGCNIQDLEIIYNAVKSNDTATIDSMEKEIKIEPNPIIEKTAPTVQESGKQSVKDKIVLIICVIVGFLVAMLLL